MNPVSVFSRKRVAKGWWNVWNHNLGCSSSCCVRYPRWQKLPSRSLAHTATGLCKLQTPPLGIFWGRNWSWDQKELCSLDLPVPSEAQDPCLLLSRYMVAIKEMIKKNGLWGSSWFSRAGSWDFFSILITSNDITRKASCKRRIKYQCPQNLGKIH